MTTTTSIVTIANQKGGVAKTTSVGNLASSYAVGGHKVLIVDLDFQANLTSLYGAGDVAKKHSIARAIVDKTPLDELIVNTKVENVDIIPSTRELLHAKDHMAGKASEWFFLKTLFDHPKLNEYEIVLIDTHPSLDIFFKAALVASHYYIIPVFAESDSMSGLANLIGDATEITQFYNANLTLLGVFITRFDSGNTTHKLFSEKLVAASKGCKFHLFKTKVPASRAVAGASASALPLSHYKNNIPAVVAYNNLAGEIFPLLRGKRVGRRHLPVKLDVLSKGDELFEQALEL